MLITKRQKNYTGNNVGIVRTESGMDEAIDQLHQIQDTAESNFHVSARIVWILFCLLLL